MSPLKAAGEPLSAWRPITAGLLLLLTVSACALLLAGYVCGSSAASLSTPQAGSCSSCGSTHAPAPATAPPAAAVRVFVGVLSTAANSVLRSTIRATWGADERLARVMFFVLRPRDPAAFQELQREAAAHRDLAVTSEIEEGYRNITHSTLALFRAAAALGRTVTHVLKADDDSLVRVSVLLGALQAMPQQLLYAGWPLRVGSKIPREAGSKWRVPYEAWPHSERVRYAWGVGYVLSADLVALIAAGVPHLVMRHRHLVPVEDIATGLWVEAAVAAHNLSRGMTYDNSSLFAPRPAGKVPAFPCYSADVVTHIKRSPKAAVMRCLHEHQGSCAASCGLKQGPPVR